MITAPGGLLCDCGKFTIMEFMRLPPRRMFMVFLTRMDLIDLSELQIHLILAVSHQ